MLNMPTITPIEIAVVGAGLVLLYVVPFLLAVAEGRQRRRQQSWQAIVGDFETTAPAIAETPLSVTSPRADDSTEPPTAAAAAATAPGEIESAPVAPPLDEQTSPPAQPAPPPHAAEPPAPEPVLATTEDAVEADGNGSHDDGFELFEGPGGYSFRLEDLHRVRLADITELASDPLLPDAERMLGAQRSAITSMVVASPYPVQSACLAAVERDGGMLRLCYRLFPCLWPASRHEAVAEVVFDIDTATGAVTHHLGVRAAADLDETVRRAIRDCGGQI